MSVEQYPVRDRFDHERPFTVGIEEELMLVDSSTFAPVVSGPLVLDLIESDECFKAEVHQAMIELVTQPAWTAREAALELAAARCRAVDRLDGMASLVALGTHPTAVAVPAITATRRYLEIDDELRGIALPFRCGLHVHVALSDADQAVAVYNAARAYLPELAALSANSPFHERVDTGLASTRLKLADRLPRSGIPPIFPTWNSYVDFVSWGARGGTIRGPSYHWWDLRLNPRWGTIEFRVADVQTTVREGAAVAAFCQSLVAYLAARLVEVGPERPADSHRITENRWRALRDGLDSELVGAQSGIARPARARITALLDALEPHAVDLGCEVELREARGLAAVNGAIRQRRVAQEHGIAHVAAWAAAETEAAARTGMHVELASGAA